MSETVFTLLTPANNSGVLGLARVSLDGNVLTTDVAASGLTPDQMHLFHLHGFIDDAPERLAVAADDTDGDGIVETQEGEAAAYGPVIAGLTTNGRAGYFLETWPDVFPQADALGRVALTQTYALDPNDTGAGQAAIIERLTARLEGRVVEFHGLDVPAGVGAGTSGEAYGAGGYTYQVPVAQGMLLAPPAALDLAGAGGLASAGSADFLARASAVLGQLAPYTLAPGAEGKQGLVPENPAVADSQAEDFVALLAPSNGSGVLGLAGVHLDRAAATLTVSLWATGLTPDQVHAAHIHGFADASPSLLPNNQLDADRDGFVEEAEGAPVVGPVIQALTTDGSVTTAELGAAFPTADAAGTLRLTETYRFDAADPTQAAIFGALEDRLAGREVQLHGMVLPAIQGEGTAGEVNGEAGYKDALPVANGILLPVTLDAAGQDLAALGQMLTAMPHPAADTILA